MTGEWRIINSGKLRDELANPSKKGIEGCEVNRVQTPVLECETGISSLNSIVAVSRACWHFYPIG